MGRRSGSIVARLAKVECGGMRSAILDFGKSSYVPRRSVPQELAQAAQISLLCELNLNGKKIGQGFHGAAERINRSSTCQSRVRRDAFRYTRLWKVELRPASKRAARICASCANF